MACIKSVCCIVPSVKSFLKPAKHDVLAAAVFLDVKGAQESIQSQRQNRQIRASLIVMTLRTAEMEIRITSISAHHKHFGVTYKPMPVSALADYARQKPVKPTIDPALVMVAFTVLDHNRPSDAGSVFFMKTRHARKLGIMPGDELTLKITKTKSGRETTTKAKMN